MTRRKTTDYIVVHSTNTKPNVDLSARDIDERHRKRGLLKIGYHCVIKRDGTIELGRPFNEIGAHLQDYDIKSVGICIIGGHNNLEKTDCPSFDVQEWWESNYQINFKIGGL